MSELRIDPLTGQRVILSPAGPDGPGTELRAAPAPRLERQEDPLAEGHEDRTPAELYAVRPDGSPPDTPGWSVRVVAHPDPALHLDAPAPAPHPDPDLFWAGAARGSHEVIVNAPQSVTSLRDLAVDQVACAMEVWRERMRAHAGAACIHLVVDERPEAGAAPPHTHAQLYALDFVPAMVARERERFGAYATRTMGGNLLADLVQQEVRQRERIVAIDEEAVLMAPYASRVPYQLLIAPRIPRARFEDAGPVGAELLHDALRRLARRLGAAPALNLWVRTAPSGAEHFCWRIDILPRLTPRAGLELGAGLSVNRVAPERAAAELRAV